MFEFTLPDLGEGVAEGELLEWHVSAGDRVEADQILAEVETDKAAVDVPAPVDGTVAELHGDPGDVIAVGDVLVTIDTEGEGAEASEGEASDEEGEPSEEAQAAEEGEGGEKTEAAGESEAAEPSAAGGRVFAPPNVRRLARELGVDIEVVVGSGPSGRVTESDVREAARSGAAGGASGDAAESGELELKSAVSRVESEESDEGRELKSAVRKVGESEGAPAASEGTSGEAAGPQEGEPSEGTAVKSAVSTVESERERTLATPATRRLARDLDVDIDAVPTDETRDGEPFVTAEQVRAHAEREGEGAAGEGAEPAEAAPEAGEAAGADEASAGAADTEGARREPYRGVRRTIGERMARSRREVPHATHHDTAVVPGLVAAKERLDPLAEERGVNLTYTALLVTCVSAALAEHPRLNTTFDAESEEIVHHASHDVGVATATEAGLMVPVVEGVDDLGLLATAERINDLTARARDRSIDRAAMQGGTFTVTNFGAIGGDHADPVINVPQTAILGAGELRERPVAASEVPAGADLAHDPAGGVVAAPTLPLSLAIDHRVVDGADAARFVNTLKKYLAEPRRLLL